MQTIQYYLGEHDRGNRKLRQKSPRINKPYLDFSAEDRLSLSAEWWRVLDLVMTVSQVVEDGRNVRNFLGAGRIPESSIPSKSIWAYTCVRTSWRSGYGGPNLNEVHLGRWTQEVIMGLLPASDRRFHGLLVSPLLILIITKKYHFFLWKKTCENGDSASICESTVYETWSH
jgi:hypothetical protein